MEDQFKRENYKQLLISDKIKANSDNLKTNKITT
jgi:hypothetical protein